MRWITRILAAICVCSALGRAEGNSPNVVLFVVDDLGWMDLSCQGSDYYHTPNIDSLALRGVRFTNAYAAAAICSPTRASILTGKYPARLLLTQWLPAGRWDAGKNKMREGRFLRSLPLEEVTLAEALRETHSTWHVGKWHLGGGPFSLPEQHGFDVNVAGTEHGAPGSYFFPYTGRWKIPTTDTEVEKVTMPDGEEGEYLTDRLTDEALALLNNAREKPFFLYFPYYAVHSPLDGKEEFAEKYEQVPAQLQQGKPKYAAMIESVDESVGRIVAGLEEMSLLNETIIIFTSDNGGYARATDNSPLRANKGSFYEGGIRVPLIFAGPGIREGVVSDVPVTTNDLYPSILELAGKEAMPYQHVDGVSLSDHLKGGTELQERSLFWHYPHYNRHPHSAPVSVIRKGSWKRIEFLETGAVELYNLELDPGEKNDLSLDLEMALFGHELGEELDTWRHSVGAEEMSYNAELEIDVEKQDLFTVGDLGYKRFHIPGLVVTAKGTVLAWCEARINGSDWDDIDILLRRSTDDGATWSEPVSIAKVDGPKEKNPAALQSKHVDPDTVTYNNPVMIADRDGTVHMLFCLEYMRCFYQRSEDDGLTWSQPIEITDTFGAYRPDYDWKVLATGPNHGIQLENGRLVVPVWLSTGTGGNAHRPSVTSTIFSDDGGQTWEAGEIAVPCTETFVNPNETVAVQLEDGTVLLNSRNESLPNRRIIVTSPDGATNWSEPRFQEELLEPICMGGMIRYEHDGEDLILFSNPHNLVRADGGEAPGKGRDRRNVSIHVSEDGGETWVFARSLEPGWSAYSDLAVTKEGTILCFYGRGEVANFAGDRMTVARFDLDWLLGQNRRRTMKADVCVYGGTSGGVVAAVQAARMGKKVIMLEPGRHLGGMTSGGLSAVDIGEPRSIGGIAREYFTRLVAKYGKRLNWGEGFKDRNGGPKTGGAYSIEPHIAEEVFDEMADEAGVIVRKEAELSGVEKEGNRIMSLSLEDGTRVEASMFIDTTYEGDLMAKAGVSYTLGREANKTYGESYNGIHYSPRFRPRGRFEQPRENGRLSDGLGVWDRDFPLDPYRVKGDPESGLLPLINEGVPGIPGEAAPGVQAYCFRLCLTTDEDNRLPLDPPDDYDPTRYELVARFIEACLENGDDMDLRWFSKYDPLPNNKWDFNTATFGGNLPGLSWEWPEASYEERNRLAKDLEDYHRGLFHFLRTDFRVPEKVKTDLSRFGLPRDEFIDNGGWPHQVYVREGRRMVSHFVMTENHTFGREISSRPVSLGSYGTDAHEIRRIVKDGVVVREGKIATGRGGFGPYGIDYRAIVPKQDECANLFVTFALSASHSAFASIRMEPPFMVTSQSAATAACIAIDEGVAAQELNYGKLRTRLLSDGQILDWTLTESSPRSPLSGIVIDDKDAVFRGDWVRSNAAPNVSGSDYVHDGGSDRGEKSATFEILVPKTGRYNVRLLYTAHSNRASNVPVSLKWMNDIKTVLVDQKKPLMAKGEPRSIGVYRFESTDQIRITVSNSGVEGIVSVDGIQMIPVE